jgi:hypothetical protein
LVAIGAEAPRRDANGGDENGSSGKDEQHAPEYSPTGDTQGDRMTLKKFAVYYVGFTTAQAAWLLGRAYRTSLAQNQDELRKVKRELDQLKKDKADAEKKAAEKAIEK